MKVLLMSVMMTSIVALRNLSPVEGLLPVSASNEENGNMTKIFLQEHAGLSSLLKITQKNIDIQTRDDLLAIVEDAATENDAAAVANGISKEKLEAEKKKIANAIKFNMKEKAKLNAALAANAEAQEKNEDMKAVFLQQKKINAETRAFFEEDSRRDPTGAMIAQVKHNEANNAQDLKDNAKEADAILKTRDEINKSVEKNAQELATLRKTRDANKDALTENATEKIKLDATTAALNLIREVVTKNSAKAVPYEQVGGPGEFCSGARLWAGGSEGQTDCQNKCSGYNECRFYSFYNTSIQYCLLTTNCDERGETGNGKPIIMERNMEAVPVPGPYKFEVIKEACGANMITSAGQCKAAADALGIRWNSCCQRGNGPYGCVKRNQDNDVFFNGYAETTGVFKYDPRGLSAVCHQDSLPTEAPEPAATAAPEPVATAAAEGPRSCTSAPFVGGFVNGAGYLMANCHLDQFTEDDDDTTASCEKHCEENSDCGYFQYGDGVCWTFKDVLTDCQTLVENEDYQVYKLDC